MGKFGEKRNLLPFAFLTRYSQLDGENAERPESLTDVKTEWDSKKFPHQALLTWKGINVASPVPAKAKWNCCPSRRQAMQKDPKQILKNVSGFAKPGELLAIMGASGAGKSTLLNVLTMKNRGSLKITGQVTINHQPVTSKLVAAMSAYVQQDDLFIGTLTVREQLIFQALLRLGNGKNYPKLVQRVEDVIQELGLTKCQDTLIGIPGRVKGISGGEKRRLAVACEVLTDPPLLFCDEPTSGLDSFMAQSVVMLLKELANKDKTVICTIHQPSSQLYSLFDKFLYLAEGRVAYLGTKDEVLDFFSVLNYQCPPNYNPGDFIIHTLAITTENGQKKKELVAQICDAYEASDAYRRVKDEVVCDVDSDYAQDMLDSQIKSPYKVSWCKQFRAVMWRTVKSIIREPLLIKMRLIQTILVGLLIGIFFWRQDMSQMSVNNINGVLFFLIVSSTYQYLFAVVNVFCTELPIFLREHWNGLYRGDVYFLCKTLAEQPLFILLPCILLSICYWMIGLNPDPIKFGIACLIFMLIANAATSFGYLVSAVSPTVTTALSLAPIGILPLLLFGGFFMNKRSVPWYFVWLEYISWFKYGYEALCINQWKDVDYIECNVNNITCPRNGLVILQTLDFHPRELVPNVVLLAILVLGLRFLAFLAFIRRGYTKQ